jgi:hypothetical protein
MSFIFADTRGPFTARLQHFFWLHPEWWSVVLCWFAWAVMLFRGWRPAQHLGQHAAAFPHELAGWLLMVAAMMLPLVLHAVRMTAVSSFWARRHLAVAEFLIGFFVAWLVLGVVAAGLCEETWAHTYAAPGLCFAFAALWQMTPMHAHALIACHLRRPLPPLGWRADLGCLQYGGTVGIACIWSCWPLMLACTFAGHKPIALAGCMVVGAAERWSFRPRVRTILLVTLAMASYFLVLAGLDRGLAIASQEPSTPQLVGSTGAPFYLEKGTTEICVAMHSPTVPAALRVSAATRRVFLNIESMKSDKWSPPFDVYLNVPPKGRPEQHPELYAGPLPMFGLVEANRRDGKDPPKGLYEQFDITKLYAFLEGSPSWDVKNLRVSFVPRNPEGDHKIQVGRVSLYMTWTSEKTDDKLPPRPG